MLKTSNFNTFSALPYIPYNIISHLAQDPKAEGFWKLLKYDGYDALEQDNLSLQEKLSMVYKNQANQNEYSVFLTNLLEDEQTRERTILKVFKNNSVPVNAQVATICYEFDILCGAKMAVVDYQGVPCNRLDVAESILLNSLNGIDVAGVGFLQFNYELSRLCRSSFGLGNNMSFVGTGIIIAVQVSNISDGC
jgi:hypothetical protein